MRRCITYSWVCALSAPTFHGLQLHRAEPDPVPPPANETLPFIPEGLPSDDIRFGRGNATLPAPSGPPESGPAPPPNDPVAPLPNFRDIGVGEEHLEVLKLPPEVEPYPPPEEEAAEDGAAASTA